MFSMLSTFQKSAICTPPVPPALSAVIKAAMPAFEAGFAYTASHWRGELTVTLHYQGAELGSSAPAAVDNYSCTTARLLAGLLGIPLLEVEDACEAEPDEPEAEQQPALTVVPDTPETADDVAPEAAADADDELEDDEEFSIDPIAEDVTRALSDAEKATAVQMVKVLPTEQRKFFTKTFREVFQVPPDSKQIVPFITELQHLQFIDRYTVEAAGGIAA